MESIINFFTLFYSTPIVIYSIPFTIFFGLMILSLLGLQFDFNLDGEADFDSTFVKGFFTHFNAVKIPFTLFMVLFFMFSSIFTTIFADLVTDNTLFISIFMVAIIYPMLWLAIIPLSKLGFVLDNTIEYHKVDYIGSDATVASVEVTEKRGYAKCVKNNIEHQIDIYCDPDDVGIQRGDVVMVISYNEDKKRYLVQK